MFLPMRHSLPRIAPAGSRGRHRGVGVGGVEEGLEGGVTGAKDGDEAGNASANVPVHKLAGCAERFELLEDQGKDGCAVDFDVDEQGQ